ncbi:Alpha/Beta hydrolase protein [Sporodiniella umbellata]|nr:Alpha/Beta hydrolase protein [Sporodiniella umbellata]
MNSLRGALNKIPASTTIKLLKKVFSLPAPAARLILNDVTKPRSSHKPWIHKVPWNNEWSGCWIGENINGLSGEDLNKRIYEADIVLFNVHGGGFRVGSCTMYMDNYIEWIKLLKYNYGMEVIIMSIDYRLAPEYKYPSPVEDVVRGYEYLIKTLNIDSEKIVVIGDSAGASLILEMLFITHDPSMFEIVTDEADESMAGSTPTLTELPRPAAAVLVSPIVTNETNSESWKTNLKYDYISQYTARVIKKDYFEKGVESADSHQVLGIAKLETGFRAFLPNQVLMYIGNKEVLRDDALNLAMRAENDNVNWETVVEDCVHNWFVVPEVVKDKSVCQRANTTFADFCYRAIRQIPNQNSPVRADFYSGRYSASPVSTVFSSRRTSEGLEMVLEDDEEEKREEVFYQNRSDSESTTSGSFEKIEKIEKAEKVTKQKPKTVFV